MAQANSGSIMGYVYDATTKKAIPNAQIYSLRNGKPDVGTTSDLQGFFVLPNRKPDANYLIVVSATGHHSVQLHCSVLSAKATVVELSLPMKLDSAASIILRTSPSTFISNHFSSAILERERSKAYIHRCVQDTDGYIGRILGTRDDSPEFYIGGIRAKYNRKTKIFEPVEPIGPTPEISKGVPAKMENHETVPKAASPQ